MPPAAIAWLTGLEECGRERPLDAAVRRDSEGGPMPIVQHDRDTAIPGENRVSLRDLVTQQQGATSLNVTELVIEPGVRRSFSGQPVETAYMLVEGSIQMVVGDERRTVCAGSTLLAPADTAHELVNDTWVDARLVVITTVERGRRAPGLATLASPGPADETASMPHREEGHLIPTDGDGRSFATPPGALRDVVVPNHRFYVRNHWEGAPHVDRDTYRLDVSGDVSHPLQLSMDRLLALPSKRLEVTLECCGNSPVPHFWALQTRPAMDKVSGHGLVGNAVWRGVPLAQVLEMAAINESAVEVVFTGADHGPDEVAGEPPDVTYERSLPIAKATHPDTLLAYEMNGEPLPPLHGSPLRLIVPGWYGMTSVKWLVGVTAIDHTFAGFYQTSRYMVANGPAAEHYYTYLTEMRVKSIITSPAPGESVPLGTYRIAGAAWSGTDEIIGVEVSSDAGLTWWGAHLSPRTDYSWQRWEAEWTPQTAGRYTLMSRATNSSGETQPMEFPNVWDGRSYGNNMVFSRIAEVRDVTAARSWHH